MVFKGAYKQKYTIDREAKELIVEAKLHKNEGLIDAGQNVYYATATANGKDIEHKCLPYCVNAQHMAEKIGKEIILAWKLRAKKQNKSFRLKKK